mgnify:FL=1|tara:strand:- start:330 stop:578 length:249 start_codon:yes stop_codon:yes gene_type:complete
MHGSEPHENPDSDHGLRDATITALVLSLSFGGFLLADSLGDPGVGVDKLAPAIALILVVWGGTAFQIVLTRLWRKYLGRTKW